MLKMAAGSHTLSKQLSVEVLLEQGHQMDLALHSKQLVEPFQHGGGKAQLFDHTDMSPYELSPHNLEKSPGMGNLGKRLNQLGVELRSIELFKTSHSFVILKTRELIHWAAGEEEIKKQEEADE